MTAAIAGFRGVRARPTPSLVISFAMLAVVLALIVVVPLLPGFAPLDQDLSHTLVRPFTDPKHMLGTDSLGRDVLYRLSVATRVSVLIALSAVAISFIIGSLIGLLAGYRGGVLDTVLMGWADIQLSVPLVLILVVCVSALGSSVTLLVVVIGLTNWISYARVSRAVALSLRGRDFVLAPRTFGVGGFGIVRRHIVPEALPRTLILAAFDVGVVVSVESALSFLGLGVQPPTPSLGLMIADGQQYLRQDPGLVILPALAIFFIVAGVQFAAQSLGGVNTARTGGWR